jgi:hypothetical protein
MKSLPADVEVQVVVEEAGEKEDGPDHDAGSEPSRQGHDGISPQTTRPRRAARSHRGS